MSAGLHMRWDIQPRRVDVPPEIAALALRVGVAITDVVHRGLFEQVGGGPAPIQEIERSLCYRPSLLQCYYPTPEPDAPAAQTYWCAQPKRMRPVANPWRFASSCVDRMSKELTESGNYDPECDLFVSGRRFLSGVEFVGYVATAAQYASRPRSNKELACIFADVASVLAWGVSGSRRLASIDFTLDAPGQYSQV